MKHFIRKNTWLTVMDCGWGNGYVIIPKGHPCHGRDYDYIDVNVHGGLTFAQAANELDWPEITEDDKEGWVVGFDTAHYQDIKAKWPEANVEIETLKLKEQLEAMQ